MPPHVHAHEKFRRVWRKCFQANRDDIEKFAKTYLFFINNNGLIEEVVLILNMPSANHFGTIALGILILQQDLLISYFSFLYHIYYNDHIINDHIYLQRQNYANKNWRAKEYM